MVPGLPSEPGASSPPTGVSHHDGLGPRRRPAGSPGSSREALQCSTASAHGLLDMSSVGKPHNANPYWRGLVAGTTGGKEEGERMKDEKGETGHLDSSLILHPSSFPDPGPDDSGGVSRRRWLQLMGASLALAGVGGCRYERAEILPFSNRPADRTPGKPERFATAMDLAGSAVGLVVTCVDGRLIKIEGNPDHPASLGATDALAQAAVLELYDPDRSQHVVENGGSRRAPTDQPLVGARWSVRTWQQFSD